MFITSVVKKVFGSSNDRLLKQYSKIVAKINALEGQFAGLTDQELKNKTSAYKNRYTQGESLDNLLPEAFATVREVAKRTVNMRHFDVQLIGGMVLHAGKIAEMRTGEGKTIVPSLSAYLNSLTGYGVHIVTVNDYLVQRDAKWMEPIYSGLGLSVGIILHGMSKEEKQANYKCDIIYGTNNEFGFDYLRDNMAFATEDRLQQKLSFAIVDEVDSILIDEARTPLIISGADQDSSALYIQINKIIPHLVVQTEKDGVGDYSIDEKAKQAYLTEDGHTKVEAIMIEHGLLQATDSLYDAGNIMLMHHLYAALRAHALFKVDVDYIIKNDQVVIVDEFTGRTMPGRRWSDGLHQAVEAKENVTIQNESQTLASITFQNYFRLYAKLAGMTGTADTEAYEFHQIYGLDVVVIPTNQPNKRTDMADLIYLSQEEKFAAIIEDIHDCAKRTQPVLVGTTSIETSELLSQVLKQNKISHQVLNAKFHEKEAQIVAEAGRPSAVTIATNMAGRGTDIVLGGNLSAEIDSLVDATPEMIKIATDNWLKRHNQVVSSGGLHIIGTERHESRRIDNQLRGRSGRQGDPGSTRFYLSVKDNLMRIFVSDKISALLSRLGSNGEAITHPWVTKAIENAQRKVEGHNFEIRKQLLDFDDVANDQRKVVYQQRNELMEANDISATICEIVENVVYVEIAAYIPPQSLVDLWDVSGLMQALHGDFGQVLPIDEWLAADNLLHEEGLKLKIYQHFKDLLAAKEQQIDSENMRHLEKSIMLNVLDNHWKEHLATMDYMRQSIHLRGYAQKDPKQEYKREAFNLFTAMLESIKREVVSILAVMQINEATDLKSVDANMRSVPETLQFQHAEAKSLIANDEVYVADETAGHTQPYVRSNTKIGRNAACPCGSGKKYKQCHGIL